jgi:hypothetical protein
MTLLNVGRDLWFQMGFDTGNTQSGLFDSVQIGSDGTAAAAANTTLGSELAGGAGTYSHTDGGHAVQMSATFAAGTGTGSVREMAISTATTEGNLFVRNTFGLVTKNAADSLTVTWTGSLT